MFNLLFLVKLVHQFKRKIQNLYFKFSALDFINWDQSNGQGSDNLSKSHLIAKIIRHEYPLVFHCF